MIVEKNRNIEFEPRHLSRFIGRGDIKRQTQKKHVLLPVEVSHCTEKQIMSSLRDDEIGGDRTIYNHYTPNGVKSYLCNSLVLPFLVLACSG